MEREVKRSEKTGVTFAFPAYFLLRQHLPSRSQLVKRRLLQLGYQPLVGLAPGFVH